MDVFEQVKQQEPESKLLLVGGGNELKTIRQKCEELKLEQDVIFTGVRDDVANLMQAMDVFVFPSLYEGLGISLIEAQAEGLPCIVSDAIPQDAYITDLLTEEKLSSTADIWAKRIFEKVGVQRTDRSLEFIAHNFDILTETKKLERFYTKIYEQLN